MPEPPIAAAVIVRGGQVLLVCRRVAEGSLRWQFPAGALEPGEVAADAAVRETREETGLEVIACAVLGERVHPVTGREVIYVACQAVSGTVCVADAEEISQVTWCPVDDLAAYVPSGFCRAVQAYLDAGQSPGQAQASASG